MRFAVLCLRESREAVLAIFLLRFLLPSGAGFAPGAAKGTLLLGAVAWVCAVAAVYLYNGVTDVAENRSNGSVRPIASGLLPVGQALGAVRALAVSAVLAGVLVSVQMGVIASGFLLLGHAYSAPGLALKRNTPGTIAVVIGGGALTYLAGLQCAGLPLTPGLLAFCAAMCLWMGLVGAIAKDFSDVAGDARHGRRNWTVVYGPTATAVTVTISAVAIGAGLLVCVLALAALALLPAALVLLGGALALAGVCLGSRWYGTRARRRLPYRVFMITQYAAHLVAFAYPIS